MIKVTNIKTSLFGYGLNCVNYQDSPNCTMKADYKIELGHKVIILCSKCRKELLKQLREIK